MIVDIILHLCIFQSKQEPTTELDSSSSNANAMVLKNTRKRLLMNDPLDLLSPSEDDEDVLTRFYTY